MRGKISSEPVANYSEPVKDELNDWKFAVAAYETKRTFHRQLPVEYNRKSKLEWDVPATGCTDANFALKSR